MGGCGEVSTHLLAPAFLGKERHKVGKGRVFIGLGFVGVKVTELARSIVNRLTTTFPF